MALLSELVRIVAEVEGLDEVSVGIVARHAREAGHIKQGGRGRAAAKMEVKDAANLLIAVNACALAKEVAEAIEVYRSMQADHQDLSREGKTLSKKVDVFRTESTFGDDLERVLTLCGDPTRRAALAKFPVGAVVEFERPSPRSRISINILNDEGVILPLHRRYRPIVRTTAEAGDRKDTTMISSRTLIAVAEALHA